MMFRSGRSLVPWLVGLAALVGLGWALNRSQLEPAEFTFANESECKSLDPAIVTGTPANRMINALFEGLVRWDPETLAPLPAAAERWEVSDDRLTYTFHLRGEARWSDDAPVTSEDFRYSMRRLLDPRTAAEYAYQAWYIKNARKYSGGGRSLRPGDAVEVELNLPDGAANTLRGKVVHGRLMRMEDLAGRLLPAEVLDAAASNAELNLENWAFVVMTENGEQRFRYADDVTAALRKPPGGTAWCRQVLLDFRDVGIEVVDPRTIRFTLTSPTPFFLNLLGFYPLFPVQQNCVERYGSPEWTEIENIVCNGPFRPVYRRLRDRTRIVKNGAYWNRDKVRLNSVDVLAVESSTTALNLYLTGKADWINDVPPPPLKALLNQRPPRQDLNPQPLLITYFYLLNTTHKPLDDVRVRRALSLAMDRIELTTRLLGAGEPPAYSLVPPGLPGYDPPQCDKENAEEARRLLAEAGYPDGRGFPAFEIVYNTHEGHQAVAQLIRKQWQRNLGIRVRTRNEEFNTLLTNQRLLNYDISRRSWNGDYADPNTFLDMFVTGGEQNSTGWSHPEYDRLVAAGAREGDPEQRLALLAKAERILMDELPIVPMYFYVNKNMVKAHVRGFYNNILDYHPVWAMWIDREGKTPNPFLKGRP